MEKLVTINCRNTSNRRLNDYHITCGIPSPRGRLTSTKNLAIRLSDGKLVSVQSQVTSRWQDKSIKWLVLDFEMPFAANANSGDLSIYEKVELVEVTKSPGERQPVRISESQVEISASNKYSGYRCRKKTSPFSIPSKKKEGIWSFPEVTLLSKT